MTLQLDRIHTVREVVFFIQIYYIIGLFCLTLYLLASIGPENFADYLAYVTFHKEASQDTYFFEIIPRMILSGDFNYFRSLNSADTLIVFAFSWNFLFFLFAVSRDLSILQVFVIFSSIFFPFILTTGLRVGPAYLPFLFFVISINSGRISLKLTIIYMIPISFLFHDSVFLATAVLIAVWVLGFLRINGAGFRKVAIALSIFLLLLAQSNLTTILLPFAEKYMGARAVYVGGSINSGTFAVFYFVAMSVATWMTSTDKSVSETNKNICCLFLLVCTIMFPIAPVASFRMSQFLIIALIGSRHCILTQRERSIKFKIFFLPVYFFVFCVQFTQVLI